MRKQGLKNITKIPQEPEKQPDNPLVKYHLSTDIIVLLEKIAKYGIVAARSLPCDRMSQLCELQLKRLKKLKETDPALQDEQLDNELTISVVGIQARILMEGRRYQQISPRVLSPSNRGTQIEQPRQQTTLRRYEILISQIDKNESQIRRFMDGQVSQTQIDFANCYFFFLSQTRKLKRISHEKLISARIRLMQTLSFFLKEAALKLQPNRVQQIEANPVEQSALYSSNVSYTEINNGQNHREILTYEEVNKWSRFSSRFLQDKVVELSGICEQIPQLQTFKRTLQFAQLQSGQRISFFKIVQVLISLHHKVAYLSRNKPQLLRQFQQAKNEISFVNTRVQEFLSQMTQQTNQILAIHFNGLDQHWRSQLSQEFTQLRVYLSKLSEIIISQDLFHTQNYTKIERLIKLIQLFGKVLAGQQQSVQQWEEIVNSQQDKDSPTLSNEQYRVLMLLQDCLQFQHSRMQVMQQTESAQISRTNQQLQVEVTKLIQDYERLKGENTQLVSALQIERRLREQLLVEVDERDKMINNLSAKKLGLQKKLAKQEGNSTISNRSKQDQLRKYEHQVQKYLESSLLLKEQLKVSQTQREKLIQQLQNQKQQYVKAYQLINRLKPEKERLQIECQQLQNRLQSQKTEQLRHNNRHNKIITDLTNDKSLLQMQLDTAERNNLKLMERLELNQKKLAQYSKLMMARLQDKDDSSSLPRVEREVQRLRKQLQNAQTQIKDYQQQNKSLRDQLANARFRLKQNQFNKDDSTEKQLLVAEMKGKIDKLQARNQTLTKSLQQAKSHEEQLQEKLRVSNKRFKQLQGKERDFQNEKNRLTKINQQSERKCQDLQRQLEDLRKWSEQQVRTIRQSINKKDLQLLQKTSTIRSLQAKIKLLEEQITQKSQQSERATQELIQSKMKHYQTTIQTQKLIQLKLQEQTRNLKKQVQGKIQNEMRLSAEIDRLSKEIDRMKWELEKCIRQLSQKEIVIRLEREKNEQQIKRLRQFQIREKIRQEQQMNTPHRDKPFQQDDTSSQIDDPMGRSNIKYDNYFNAKEYDRLYKEYNDFKKHISHKLETQQATLQQTLRANAKLKAQILGLQGLKDKQNAYQDQAYKIQIQKVRSEFSIFREKHRDLGENNRDLGQKNKELGQRYKEVSEKNKELGQRYKEVSEKNKQLAQRYKEVSEKNKELGQRYKEVGEKNKQLTQRYKEVNEKNKQLGQRYKQVGEKNKELSQKYKELCQKYKQLGEKNKDSTKRIYELQMHNQSLNQELQKGVRRLSQQNLTIDNLKKQKRVLQQKLSASLLQTQSKSQVADRQLELLLKIKTLQDQVKQLQQLNKDMKSTHLLLQQEMEKQTKQMFVHYEAEMKRVVTQTDSVNSRLALEVDSLRKQLLTQQQTPSKLQKQKEQAFNELKRSIEIMLAEKNKLINQNTKLISEKTISQTQRLDYKKRTEQLTIQVSSLTRERDLIRSQHESMRQHLQQQTKRAIYLESQLLKNQSQLQQYTKIITQHQTNIRTYQQRIKYFETDKLTKSVHNVDYLYAKIKALQQALQAVGDQLSDSKISNSTSGTPRTANITRSQIVMTTSEQIELQRLTQLQREWTRKQKFYLQQLQSMSRQIYSLKDIINSSRPADRPIVTSLPDHRPANSTYSEQDTISSNNLTLIRVQKILEGKRRWQSMRFSESLVRWGVPAVVCQEIQDLRLLFLNTSETISTVNQEQLRLQKIIRNVPSLENLLQYVFRILTFFSEVPLNSPEGIKIRNELTSISKQYSGGYFFTVLEQFTIHVLQNNAIEEYKRQLRTKAKELLEIKVKLDQLITRQIEQEERIYNKPQPLSGRPFEPSQYRSGSINSSQYA